MVFNKSLISSRAKFRTLNPPSSYIRLLVEKQGNAKMYLRLQGICKGGQNDVKLCRLSIIDI